MSKYLENTQKSWIHDIPADVIQKLRGPPNWEAVCAPLMTDCRIGIDPGVSGAIAVVDSTGAYVDGCEMPTYKPGKASRVNASMVRQFLACYTTNATCWLEQVGAMPGQGVSSMFSFGHAAGVVEGVLGAMEIPYRTVTPQSWKKAAGLTSKDKEAARALAQRLCPTAPLGRKKDAGLAEAILIARHGL